jgi:hypothetical protein
MVLIIQAIVLYQVSGVNREQVYFRFSDLYPLIVFMGGTKHFPAPFGDILNSKHANARHR